MEVTIGNLEKRFSDENTKLEERLHAFEKKNEASNVQTFIKPTDLKINLEAKSKLGGQMA